MKVIKFAPGLIPVFKHQEHDQSTHGSWANSSERSAKEIEIQQRITQIEHQSYPVDEDGMASNRVTAIYETKDGTKIKLLHDNEKTADGVISMTTKAFLFVPGGVKQIADLESSRDKNMRPGVGAMIDRILVEPEFQRQGIATAMLNFARSYSQDNIKIEHSHALSDDAKGWSAVVKHEEHDQSTHGSWATGQTGDASTRELLLQQASQYETFEEFSNAVSLQGLRPRAWHIADTGFKLDPNFKPMSRTGGTSDEPGLFVGDPETWQDYAAGRSTVIEYDVSNLSFTSKPLADTSADFFPDQSGNQGFFIRPSAFSRLREVRRMPIEEALSRAKQQQDAMPKSKAEAKQIWEESRSIKKHAMHDQKTHGSWATGGNGLGIEEVMRLHKTSDPLKMKVYEAEQSIDKPSKNPLEKPTLPKRDDFESREDYDKAYKAYSKKWLAWAVEEQASILSDTGKKFLDGTPAGVKKYVEAVIKQDWFIERFGDGSSLPKVDVKTSNTNAAGRHILKMQKDRASGRIIKTVHEISIDRQSTRNERVLLHEITHYATAITQTEAFSPHGAEFARNHIFVVEQMSGSARAEALATAYTEKGVQIDN